MRPAEPPCTPYGWPRRRSVRSVTLVSVSISYSRTRPSPPRERAGAAAVPAADRVLPNAHGQVVLDGLDRRVARVAHVRVHAAEPGSPFPAAHAAAHRFVVRKAAARARIRAAERHVVHRALAGRGHAIGQRLAERAEHDIGDALRGFDVAAGDRRRLQRIDDGSLRRDDRQRPRRRPRCTARRRRRGTGTRRDRPTASSHSSR